MVTFAYGMDNPMKRILCTLALVGVFGTLAFGQRCGNTAWKKYRHEAAIGYGINTVFAQLG